MPTYGYECLSCLNGFEVFQSIKDDALTVCDQCGGALRKRIYPVGIAFKGSGFYVNDYAPKPAGSSAGSAPDAAKPEAAKSEGGDAKPEAKAEGVKAEAKTEAKPETKSETKSESKLEPKATAPA